MNKKINNIMDRIYEPCTITFCECADKNTCKNTWVCICLDAWNYDL